MLGPGRRRARRHDRRDDAEPIDLGWIGEDRDGIWIARHPQAALAEHPELWWSVDRFLCGVREPGREDFETLSNFQLECMLALAGAAGRALMRRGDAQAL